MTARKPYSVLAAELLAAIDETEQDARACAGAPWIDNVPGMVHVDPAAIRENKWSLGHLGFVASTDNSQCGDAYRRHIARHDPAAVLRHAAADRGLVEWWGTISETSAIHVDAKTVVEELIIARAIAYGISCHTDGGGGA